MAKVIEYAEQSWAFLIHPTDEICLMPEQRNPAWNSLAAKGAHLLFMDLGHPHLNDAVYTRSHHSLLRPMMRSITFTNWLAGAAWEDMVLFHEVCDQTLRVQIWLAALILPHMSCRCPVDGETLSVPEFLEKGTFHELARKLRVLLNTHTKIV